MAQSNSNTLPNKEYKRIQSNERRREAYNNMSAEEKNELNARRRAMYAQKSSIKKLSTWAASFPLRTSEGFSHPDTDGSSCSLSSAHNTHRSQTIRQVDGQMEKESLHIPLSDNCHISFDMPLDLHALENPHDKYGKELTLCA
ncbi:hypothetical protein Salat_0170900 [Sesamum alatum]|uniref:Uncharacterized protein n=1 Tax=Sesamum alatum TaxID=300844 RepID=A0AAE2CXK6_9LAMI|nr:hypothetical protein Salat_0170900 [Sesamum alatum]